jgi:serine/threonine-protein phosphatase 2A activator
VDNKASRFGNPAFKTFYDRVLEVGSIRLGSNSVEPWTDLLRGQISHDLHSSLPNLPEAAIPEVATYLQESWGSRTRIDYGSGMELNFLCWL